MSVRTIHWEGWQLDAEASRRFHRICLQVSGTLLVLALWVPMLDFKARQQTVLVPDPHHPAQWLADDASPVVIVQHTPSTKAARERSATRPSQQPMEKPLAPVSRSARDIAQQAGLLQLRDQLSVMNDTVTHSIDTLQTRVSAAGAASAVDGPADLAAGAAAHSAGIASRGATVTGASGGTGLGNRRTGAVQSALSGSPSPAQNTTDHQLGAGRTLQEIQWMFDRSKGAFDAIFTRAARENAGIEAGRVSISLTIAPDGSVTQCEIISSSFGNHDLEQKILQRVKSLNFGPKNVPAFTLRNYALNFLLS